MGECTSVAILGVAGAFLFWNKGGSHEYRRCMMTVLDKIKSFFKRPKAKVKAEPPKVAEAAEKKLPEAPKK
jgi:hypothetical protein